MVWSEKEAKKDAISKDPANGRSADDWGRTRMGWQRETQINQADYGIGR